MGKRYEFGEFILDTQEGWLLRLNQPVKATPRQLALLEALVDRRGRLVEKKEILERVWEGTAVSEANLTVQMSKLRRLLGETEDQPFIETVPTRGYRFLLPVHILPPAATAALPLRRPSVGPAAEPAAAAPAIPPAAPAPAAAPEAGAPAAPAVGPAAAAAGAPHEASAPANPPGAASAVRASSTRWWPWGLAAVLVLAALGGWAAWNREAGRAAAPVAASGLPADAGSSRTAAPDGTVRLTADAADDWEPAVSPDGRTVAFVSNRHGAPAIHLLALDRRDEPPVRVATRDPAGAPSWSPDGARLAFVCQRNGQADICVIGRDGSGERVVAAEAQDELDPVWSPDGRRLAYCLVNGRTWELHVVDVDGGRPRRIGPPGWSAQAPAWSPDGGRLAVSRWRAAEHYDIWIVALDGTPPAPLVESDAGTFEPAWSPDGRRLACASDRGLVVVDVESRATTPIASTDRRDRRPSWSRDGRSLVVHSSRDGNAELYLVPVMPARGAAGAVRPAPGPEPEPGAATRLTDASAPTRFGSWELVVPWTSVVGRWQVELGAVVATAS